jgi:hypothetical protein
MKTEDDNDLEEKIAVDKHIASMEYSFGAGCLFGIFLSLVLILGTWGLIWLVQNVKI